MNKLSGLVLDIRDDHEGEVLRSIFPTPESLPDLVKTAQKITPELDEKLPDDLFALVLHDGDTTLRKYACIDAGNTALSVEYFMKTAHKLPENAQKVAAANLCTACGWYGIEPPEELEKVAVSRHWIQTRIAAAKPSYKRVAEFAGKQGARAEKIEAGPAYKTVAGRKRGVRVSSAAHADKAREASLAAIRSRRGEAVNLPPPPTGRFKKTSSINKKAIGAVTIGLGAMLAPGIAKQTKANLAATKSAGGRVMTPEEIKQRSAVISGGPR